MVGTTFGIIMIVVAAVTGLVVMEVLVLAAAERPYFKHPHPGRMYSNVRGGIHLGDPRSVSPEDEPAAGRTPGAGAASDSAVATDSAAAGNTGTVPGRGPAAAGRARDAAGQGRRPGAG